MENIKFNIAMNLLYFCLSIFFAPYVFAFYTPSSIIVKPTSQKAVFIDLIDANYKIHYDISKKMAQAISTLTFDMKENGFPILDLVPKAKKVFINNQKSNLLKLKLPGAKKIKYLNTFLKRGRHILEIHHQIKWFTRFKKDRVRALFWMNDRLGRWFLERYLPTNLEYDQYKMNLEVKVTGTDIEHEVLTNGRLSLLRENHFKIDYPEHFNASSLFFHLISKNYYKRVDYIYNTFEGNEIPIMIYGKKNLSKYIPRRVESVAATLGFNN